MNSNQLFNIICMDKRNLNRNKKSVIFTPIQFFLFINILAALGEEEETNIAEFHTDFAVKPYWFSNIVPANGQASSYIWSNIVQ